MRFSKKKVVSCEIGANYQSDDSFLALKLILFSFLFKTKKYVLSVENWFADYLGHKNRKQIKRKNKEKTKNSKTKNINRIQTSN